MNCRCVSQAMKSPLPLSDGTQRSLVRVQPLALSFNIRNNTVTAYVASDLSSTCQLVPPIIAEVQGALTTLLPYCLPSLVLPRNLPRTGATPMPAQELVLSFPSPASLDAFAGISRTGPNNVRAIPLSHMPPSFLDRVAQPSTRPRYSTRRPSPPHAEPSLVTNHDGEAVPNQS